MESTNAQRWIFVIGFLLLVEAFFLYRFFQIVTISQRLIDNQMKDIETLKSASTQYYGAILSHKDAIVAIQTYLSKGVKNGE